MVLVLVGVLVSVGGVFAAVGGGAVLRRRRPPEARPSWSRVLRRAAFAWLLLVSTTVAVGGIREAFAVYEATQAGMSSGALQQEMARNIAAAMQLFVLGAVVGIPGPALALGLSVGLARRSTAGAAPAPGVASSGTENAASSAGPNTGSTTSNEVSQPM